ncbi:MAG: serine/threonine protein kinase [Acidobacteria bacterium]|nr:serine/threonine protein kinase [Acidobacteriota bacterium]
MQQELSNGSRFGDYQIREELGRGGMGHVYRARHLTLDRDVALKLLASRYSADEAYLQRFLKEARSAARLNHRNIVQIYDFGRVDSAYYLAMEFVPGRSFGWFLRTSGPVSEADAIAVTRQACTALGVAHAGGVIHRDVKPDNFILRQDGIVKLVDLGLAKSLADDQNLTQTGVVAGTPNYISPEQIAGLKDLDGRTDIYSLGATLFHLVTGRPPYEGSSPMVIIAKHLHDELPDPRSVAPNLSEGICAVIRKMMAREREMRYSDTREVDAALAVLQSGSATPPRAASSHAVSRTAAMPSMPTAASAPSLSWDANLLARVETPLAAAIGPLAKVLVKKAAQSSSDLHDLCAKLSQQIPSETQRNAFMSEVLDGLPRQATAPTPSPSVQGSQRINHQAAGAEPPSEPEWSQESLHAVERRLATEIGPLARVLVKRAAKKASSWEELVNELGTHVASPAAQSAFRDDARKLVP